MRSPAQHNCKILRKIFRTPKLLTVKPPVYQSLTSFLSFLSFRFRNSTIYHVLILRSTCSKLRRSAKVWGPQLVLTMSGHVAHPYHKCLGGNPLRDKAVHEMARLAALGCRGSEGMNSCQRCLTYFVADRLSVGLQFTSIQIRRP